MEQTDRQRDGQRESQHIYELAQCMVTILQQLLITYKHLIMQQNLTFIRFKIDINISRRDDQV